MASHLLSLLLLLLLLYILYNIYTTTIDIPNMIFVYIILCHVKRLCYTPTLVYITLCYTMCIYALSYYDIWPWIITLYTTLIYYTITIIINIILIYFYFYYCVVVWVRICVCVVLCCLSCVCMYALLCVLAYTHTCVSVCLPRITLLGYAVVKRLMRWYRGGVYFGKKFLQNLENAYTR